MRFRQRAKPKLGIDLTPLIDVVFLLLIFFMVSTTFVSNPGIKVKLPEATSKPISEKPETLEVTLTAQNRLYLNGQEVTQAQLKTRMLGLIKTQKPPGLLIRADGAVLHRQVVYVMDQAHQLGITQLSIATIQPGR